jgi:ribosomal protein S27E
MINNSMKNRITKPGLLAMNRKIGCVHCAKETTVGNIKKHEKSCFLNPTNVVECLVCSKPIKTIRNQKELVVGVVLTSILEVVKVTVIGRVKTINPFVSFIMKRSVWYAVRIRL